MVKVALALLFIAVPTLAGAQNASVASAPPIAPDISGTWTRSDGNTRVAISPCGDQICAINTWVRDPNGNEAVGDKLVLSLTPQSQSQLSGSAYDVKRDRKYSMQISVQNNQMKTEGCLLQGVVCKSINWTRN